MKATIRFCALLLCAALLAPLMGCGASPVALSYGDAAITTNMYRYWLSSYKATFLYTYTDMTDTDAFWDSVLYDDVTAEEYLNGAALDNMKRTLVCMALFDQYGLQMSTEEIDQYIDTLIYEYTDGNKQQFNQMLAEYGINADILRDIYMAEDKVSLVYQYLYRENGPNALTEEDLDAYYRENYVRVRHIYVNDAYVYETNDAGYYQYDSDGNVVTRALTEAERAEKTAKIDAIDKALAEGNAFDTVYQTYSEDLYYVNGYYLTRNTDFIAEVVNAAFDLPIGEYTCVRSDYGTHYVMRLPLEDYAYNESTNADFFDGYTDTVANADFLTFLEERIADVYVNEEETAQYSIRNVAANYTF